MHIGDSYYQRDLSVLLFEIKNILFAISFYLSASLEKE
jgi:hypothetical protein